jgi:hypothetical protein
MKKYFALLLLLLSVAEVEAQAYKMFLNTDGKQTDSVKAISYIIYRKFTDTSWLMQQYDMHNALMQAGTFKDKDLSVPHGQFVYYNHFYTYKLNIPKPNKLDTSNFMRTYGQYKDGQKNGWWINYFKNGNRSVAEYYRNGVLNGPYLGYVSETGTVFITGNFENDRREGKWATLNAKGDTIQLDNYYHGRIFESTKAMKPYNEPKPTDDFIAFVDRAVRRIVNDNDEFKITVGFDIAADGKPSNPTIVSKGYNKYVNAQLIEALKTGPDWVPANEGSNDKPVKDFSAVVIEVVKGGLVKVTKLNYGGTKQRYYNMTH